MNVSGNDARTQGGGITVAGGATLTMTNSTVSNNKASPHSNQTGSSSGGQGGGIFNDGTVTITNSTISGNQARQSTG